jgi:hypothetical protein
MNQEYVNGVRKDNQTERFQMYAIEIRGPKGRMAASEITANGDVKFEYNTKVWQTLVGAMTAKQRAYNNNPNVGNALRIYECDYRGKELTSVRQIVMA